MKKNLNYSSITIMLLAVAVIVMSVGYANFSKSLTINGTASVGASSWSLKFVEDSYTETSGSVTVSETDRTIAETSMSYSVSLSEPGDFYEFTMNVQNAGTFDASLTGITLSELTETEKKYLVYEVYYNGTKYDTTTTGLTGIELTSGATVPVKVRIQYIQPTNAADLPSAEASITLNASLSFSQKA